VHSGGPSKNPEVEYAYKLWLAHGITTVRGVALNEFWHALSEQQRSARNEIVAPRIVNYQGPGTGWQENPIVTPEQARPGCAGQPNRGSTG
jgi:hypothetical protein